MLHEARCVVFSRRWEITLLKRSQFHEILSVDNKFGNGSLLVLLKNMTICLEFCLDLYNA
jgi:hypothetical protein